MDTPADRILAQFLIDDNRILTIMPATSYSNLKSRVFWARLKLSESQNDAVFDLNQENANYA